ncbi:hypothetical protein ATANTOWER_014513 [Ataeniobius toweri]|uniref:Uncharacterized protein n=1 Tax=Ataeniobius toweri TaxID=208326 RepID=A0ABU7AZC4_9TELE|nr:hypothetical protein [Ataeniobius toweri]
MCFDLKHSILALGVYFASMQLHPSLKSSRTVLYLAPSILPSTLNSFLVSFEGNYSHNSDAPRNIIPHVDDVFRVMHILRSEPKITFMHQRQKIYISVSSPPT